MRFAEVADVVMKEGILMAINDRTPTKWQTAYSSTKPLISSNVGLLPGMQLNVTVSVTHMQTENIYYKVWFRGLCTFSFRFCLFCTALGPEQKQVMIPIQPPYLVFPGLLPEHGRQQSRLDAVYYGADQLKTNAAKRTGLSPALQVSKGRINGIFIGPASHWTSNYKPCQCPNLHFFKNVFIYFYFE